MIRFLAPALLLLPTVAEAAEKRTRVTLGPQVAPLFPGAKRIGIRPLVDVSRAGPEESFAFEAPDESIGFTLLRKSRFAIGPAIELQGVRRREDVGGFLPRVGFSVELGGFVHYQLSPALRLRAEARQGVTGHRGLIGIVGADYVARDADRWLFSLGPRVTLTDRRYQHAYFDVVATAAAASGLPVYRAGGGVQAVGGTAGVLRQLSPRLGLYGFAKYDRLVGDAGDSPVVRRFGRRDQLSGGLALSYTFGR